MPKIRADHCMEERCGVKLTEANVGRRFGFRCQAHEDAAFAEGEKHLREVKNFIERILEKKRRKEVFLKVESGEAVDTGATE